MDRNTAQQWIERWDLQQEVSLPDREDRFTALIDAVEAGAGREDPLVLDIGCGPGSLTTRLRDRLPKATIIGIDADPVTLALAAAATRTSASRTWTCGSLAGRSACTWTAPPTWR